MKDKNIFGLVILTFSLVLLIPNSLAFGYKLEGDHMVAEDGKVYPIIVVELPYDLYYQSNYKEVWNKIYKNVSSAKDFIKIKNETIFSNFQNFSIPSIAEHFGAKIWRKTDGYAKVIVPNESYDEIVNILRGLGLNVRKNFASELHLSESRGLIGLPYLYLGSELTGKDTRIAILDTGVDTDHPDLPWGTKVIFWSDTLYSPGDFSYFPDPADPFGHGTHVCSIAAGTGVNSSGLYKGVASDAFLLVWRVCSGDCDFGAAAEAIHQAIRENADVISMSFGWNPQIWDMLFSQGEMPCSFADACVGACPPGTEEQDFFDAIWMAIRNDIPVVASAGNEGSHPNTISFPACIPGVIAVGATHKKDYSMYEEYDEEVVPERKKSVTLHTIISITSDSPPQVFEHEFNATWQSNGIPRNVKKFKPVGFQKVLQPQNWPATVRVRIEGEHRHRDCYQEERVWWDPGIKDRGDEYWTWEQTFDYNPASPYIVVEVSALANGNSGGRFSCWFETEDWYKAYYNDYTCSGTALSCDSFDLNKHGCENQLGCSWCGCLVSFPCPPCETYCSDVSKEDCESDPDNTWIGCEGTATPCEDRHQDEGEICGNPSTTGCTASWDTSSISVKMYRTDALSLKSLPTFYSSRGPSVFGIKPDVTAPGHEICAARARGTGDEESLICGNNNYIARGGSSMAAPMVAGEIALMVEASRIAGVDRSVWEGVIEANEKVFSGDPDDEEGYGLINVQKAVDYITDCALKFYDGWYCNGDIREYRDYYYDNESESCVYSVNASEDCNSYDGYYCSGTNRCGSSSGDTLEYWNYYCSEGNCVHSISTSRYCRCDAYDSDGGLAFTTTGTCTDYQGCSGGNCQSTSYTDTCIDSTTLKEYYVSGSGDSATCRYVYKNCKDYGSSYYCSNGMCYSGGGGGCPTLFVWNGSNFEEEKFLDIHAFSDITLSHKIEKKLEKGLIFYSLQLRELDEFTSHIDQVKLYAIDSRGRRKEFPLVYAWHDKLGFIWFDLFFDDSRRIDLKPTEVIDLKFLPLTNDIDYFVFEINGYNVKAVLM